MYHEAGHAHALVTQGTNSVNKHREREAIEDVH